MLAENSRRWTPYNYAYNNPVFFVDPDGMQSWGFDSYGRDLAKSGAIASWNTGNSYWNKFINGPGDEFKSKDEAATDFGMEYNAISIYLGTELMTIIYSYERDGQTFYSYTVPEGDLQIVNGENLLDGRGVLENYESPKGTSIEGDAHTHSNERSTPPGYKQPASDNNISQGDFDRYADYVKKNPSFDGYVTTPNGQLLKYDKRNNSSTLISNKLPNDLKSTTRNKEVNTFNNPRIYPVIRNWTKKGFDRILLPNEIKIPSNLIRK